MNQTKQENVDPLLDQTILAQREAANWMKDEFFALVSHEIRSPLNAILGWTKVLRSQSVDEKTFAVALAAIQRSAEKQKQLIETLLDFSRMITGNLRLNVRPISLSAVIHSVMQAMSPVCEAKEINCEIELEIEADAITGDMARLEQVIWNLVSNAVKFTPPQGKVKITLIRANSCAQITVSDTGKGIKSAHLSHIFESCWQSGTSDWHRASGLGVGLSFVRHIVGLHGGTVCAESDGEGKGAKFIINLPLPVVPLQNHCGTAADGAKQSSIEQFRKDQNALVFSPLLSSVRPVIADDKKDARELAAARLRQCGAEVMIAASAVGAPPVCSLVSDIGVEEADTYPLIPKMRALVPNKGGRLAVIAQTANKDAEDRIRALSAGFQQHVLKPIEPAELAVSAANPAGRDIQSLKP